MSALIEQTTNLIWLSLILFNALNLAVTVSALGLNLSWGKVSQAGKFITAFSPTKDLSSAVINSAYLLEVVTINNGVLCTAASRECVAAGATKSPGWSR
jgi:hypothetical protein